MAQEIERKFLMANNSWKRLANKGVLYRQGYMVSDADKSVRIRVAGDDGFICVKSGAPKGRFGRSEFEYKISLNDANEMLAMLCVAGKIEKTRYQIFQGKHVWEIDVFHADNDGLVTAEIELSSGDELFKRPPWIGKEITYDNRYRNGELAKNHIKRGDKVFIVASGDNMKTVVFILSERRCNKGQYRAVLPRVWASEASTADTSGLAPRSFIHIYAKIL